MTDHSVVCRFRKAFNDSGSWEALLIPIDGQLTQHNVSAKAGAISIVDSSVTPTPRKPQGKPTYILSEDPETPPAKKVPPGVDQEAQGVKQGGKLQYGYKSHYLAAEEAGLVLAVHTTAANVHDSQCMAS